MTTNHNSLPLFSCHKTVRAGKILDVNPHVNGATLIVQIGQGVDGDPQSATFSVDAEFCRKHHPRVGTYFVVYKDGYESISPADAFEDGYTLVVPDADDTAGSRVGSCTESST